MGAMGCFLLCFSIYISLTLSFKDLSEPGRREGRIFIAIKIPVSLNERAKKKVFFK